MFCSNCGKEYSIEMKYCSNCGISLSNRITEKKDSNAETSLTLGIMCLISSFFISILCFIPGIISILYAKKYKKSSGKLGVGFTLSIAGMVSSFIILIITILFFMLIFNITNSVDYDETNNDYNYIYTENITKL